MPKRKIMPKKLKPVPKFRSETAERRFWEKHDSTDYVNWDKAERARFPARREASSRPRRSARKASA